jgi:hypothetical protein
MRPEREAQRASETRRVRQRFRLCLIATAQPGAVAQKPPPPPRPPPPGGVLTVPRIYAPQRRPSTGPCSPSSRLAAPFHSPRASAPAGVVVLDPLADAVEHIHAPLRLVEVIPLAWSAPSFPIDNTNASATVRPPRTPVEQASSKRDPKFPPGPRSEAFASPRGELHAPALARTALMSFAATAEIWWCEASCSHSPAGQLPTGTRIKRCPRSHLVSPVAYGGCPSERCIGLRDLAVQQHVARSCSVSWAGAARGLRCRGRL